MRTYGLGVWHLPTTTVGRRRRRRHSSRFPIKSARPTGIPNLPSPSLPQNLTARATEGHPRTCPQEHREKQRRRRVVFAFSPHLSTFSLLIWRTINVGRRIMLCVYVMCVRRAPPVGGLGKVCTTVLDCTGLCAYRVSLPNILL